MGQALTFEIGKMNIGRRVKLYGRQNGHGVPGTLKGAEPKHAVVRPDGHNQDERVEWENVLDWTSHNPRSLMKPAAAEYAPLPKIAPKVIAPPASPPPQESPFAGYATLGPSLDAAIAEVRAAEDLVDEQMENLESAKQAHTAAVDRVRQLRAQAARALSAVDAVLAGTSAAVLAALADAKGGAE